MDEITSGSVLPRATAWSSLSNGIDFLWSIGRESVLSRSQTPTASTMTKWFLALASGVTALRSSSLMTRTPRPFICSKKLADLTSRMKSTHFERLDVGAGGDHVHGDGDARVVAVAEARRCRLSSGFVLPVVPGR